MSPIPEVGHKIDQCQCEHVRMLTTTFVFIERLITPLCRHIKTGSACHKSNNAYMLLIKVINILPSNKFVSKSYKCAHY